MDWLLTQDQQLLLWINGHHAAWSDDLMVLVSSKWAWIPLYALLLALLVRAMGWRQAALAAVLMVPVVLVSDQLASGVLKPLVGRLRPCHDPGLQSIVHVVDLHCGGPFGFVSSHAANFAALACHVGWLLRRQHRWLFPALWMAAALVGYSRVYLGVHFPSDVLGGFAVGTLAGFMGVGLFRIMHGWLNFPQKEGN